MITLYHAPNTRSFRALWLLEELGTAYDLVPLDLRRGAHKAPEILALNPMGKVPLVVVDGHPVWESPAILAHLCDLHPEAGLAPATGTAERADFYRWLSFGTAVMEPAFTDHFKGARDLGPGQLGWGDFAAMKAALAAGLASDGWLLASGFSAADVLIGSNLHWFLGWAPDAFADLAPATGYVARAAARPAFRRATEIDAALAAKQSGAAD